MTRRAWPIALLALVSWRLWADYPSMRRLPGTPPGESPIEVATVAIFRGCAIVVVCAAVAWAWRRARLRKPEEPAMHRGRDDDDRVTAANLGVTPHVPEEFRDGSHLPRLKDHARILARLRATWRTVTPAERIGLVLTLSTLADAVGPWWHGDPVGGWRYAAPVNVVTWGACCVVLAVELWRSRRRNVVE